MKDTAALVLQLARESESTDAKNDGRPRKKPVPLLLRAQGYSQAAENAAGAVLLYAGRSLQDMDAPLVCAMVQYGMDYGPDKGSVTGFCKFAGPSRRSVARRLQELGLPSALCIISVGVCIRITGLLARHQHRHGAVRAIACDAGFSDGLQLSQYLYRRMGVRPTKVREVRPVAVAARVMAHSEAA